MCDWDNMYCSTEHTVYIDKLQVSNNYTFIRASPEHIITNYKAVITGLLEIPTFLAENLIRL